MSMLSARVRAVQEYSSCDAYTMTETGELCAARSFFVCTVLAKMISLLNTVGVGDRVVWQ